MGEAERMIFPFSAIVGQEKAKLALLCNAVNPAIGGVLLSGDKGTGKSTMVRALADVLPEIEVVKGCPFNCNPYNELEMCDACKNSEREIERRRMRVVDLPLSVTVDRLIGTLDIQRALKEGIRALQPGLLAEANRNILYIDEVNLLDDYIADILLDAAAMGWNVIEREGVSVRHPARFILVGSMNPEEGELRPQILDRFGLFVSVEGSNSVEERIEIVKRVEEFQADPVEFRRKYEGEQKRIRESIIKARKILKDVEIDDDLLKLLSETIVEHRIRTHRAEIVTVRAAKAIAALDGRKKVSLEDLKRAMELALPHRLKSRPFDMPNMPPPKPENKQDDKDKSRNKKDEKRKQKQNEKNHSHNSHSISDAKGNAEGNYDAADVELHIPRGESGTAKRASRGSKDERATIIGYPHGYPVSSVPGCGEDVDLVATIRAAAMNGRKYISKEDIRIRVRKARMPRLTVIMLDTSGSMAAMRRISIAKGVAAKLIENSYVKRDSLALITFRGYSANVVVPPTRRYSGVMTALQSVAVGGRTPLSSALQTLLVLAKSFRLKNRDSVVKGILITDGKANTSLFGKPVKEELSILASAIKKSNIRLEIYDSRAKAIDPAPSYIDFLSHTLNTPVYRV